MTFQSNSGIPRGKNRGGEALVALFFVVLAYYSQSISEIDLSAWLLQLFIAQHCSGPFFTTQHCWKKQSSTQVGQHNHYSPSESTSLYAIATQPLSSTTLPCTIKLQSMLYFKILL